LAPIKLIVFFLFLTINGVFSQTIELGAPYCQNITPDEIGYGGAMYSIAQNEQGTMYFGNFNGLLTYNGSAWKYSPWNGKPILYHEDNQIYIGGFNCISELKFDSNNRQTITSLIDTVYDFGQIESIKIYRNQIYFVANKSLYYIANNKPKKIISDPQFLSIFVDRSKLFISTSDGLYEFNNDKFNPTEISQYFKGLEILEMFRFANYFIARTKDNFYKINNENTIEIFKTEVDKEIQMYEYSCSQKLSNNTLCIATKKNGLYFINEQGKLVNYLNTETGLYDNAIYDLFVDRANNLWAGFSNGICRIEIPSAFTYFNRSHGLHGKVTAILRHKNFMYIGTETGIYMLMKDAVSTQNFKKLFLQNIQCNVLISNNESILAGTNQGLFEITNSKPQLLFAGNIISIKKLHTPNKFWITTKTHVYLVQKNGGKLSILQTIGPFTSEINSLTIENDSLIWIGTYY